MGEQKQKDWWDKADILAKFTSSIVIAIIGLSITYNIQKNQIEFAKINSETEKRLKQGTLTSQLIQYLSSTNSTQRQIAIVALKDNLDSVSYQKILSVCAVNDKDETVRISAINELSNYKNSVNVLSKISKDIQKSPREREKAYVASIDASLQNSGKYYLIGPGELAFEDKNGGFFTNAIINVLKSGPFISLKNLISKVKLNMAEDKLFSGYRLAQTPYVTTNSTEDIIIDKNFFSKSKAIIVGINSYKDAHSLRYAVSDAKNFNNFLTTQNSQTTLLNDPSSRELKEVFRKLSENVSFNDNVIFYYSGHSYIDEKLGLVLKTEDDIIPVEELRLYLNSAKNVVIFWDACSQKFTPLVAISER